MVCVCGASDIFVDFLLLLQRLIDCDYVLILTLYHLTYTRYRGMNKSTLSSVRRTTSEVRLDEKVLHCTWHPVNNTIAVAGHAGLCLYKV